MHQVQIGRVHAYDQAVCVVVVKQHPHKGPPMARAFFQRMLDAAQVGQRRVFFVEQVFDSGHVRGFPGFFQETLGHVPFFAHHDHQFTFATQRAFGFPKARGEPPSNSAPTSQEPMQTATFVGDLEVDPGGGIKFAQSRAQFGCFRADFAGKQEILAEQQIVVIVIKRHRHPIVGKHQEGQRAPLDFVFRNQMAHQRLEEGFIRDPGGPEKPHNVFAFLGEIQNPFDCAAAQAPPLAANHNLNIIRDVAFEAQALLPFH